MKATTMRAALLSLAVLLALTGCASNTRPSGPGRNSAWIVGDPHSCTPSHAGALTIKSVDGNSTVSKQASFQEDASNPCSFPFQVDVTPGHHTVGIVFTNGGEVFFHAFSVDAQAGRIYDVSAHPVGTSWWFEAKPRMQ